MGGKHPAAVEQAEDDYLEHLYRGSDWMAAGDLPAAKQELERARALRPKHAKVLGLLGLCTFKLGELEEAASIYLALAHDNPLDVTVHVNLGLVELKRGNPRSAIRALEVATSLAPDHKKAFNYLGLAYGELQAYEQAAEAFREAGAAAMVEKMERALADERGAPAEGAVSGGSREEGEGRRGEEGAIPSLEAFTEAARLRWPRGSPFAVDEEGAAIDFAGGIYTRLDGLLVARGSATWEPVRKRFRGEGTDQPFGKAERQLHRGAGSGQLIIGGGPERLFTALRLEEDAYLAEGCLFAFEDSLDFENGRVTGRSADLHLVRLRGSGHLLLVSQGVIRSESIYGNESVRLPAARLVGWWGTLTPRWIEAPGGRWIELAGEGQVLLAT